MRRLAVLVLLAACSGGLPADGADASPSDASGRPDAAADAPDAAPDAAPASCGFDYGDAFDKPLRPAKPAVARAVSAGEVVNPEPPPPFVYRLAGKLADIVMPGYDDTMPLFARATAWTTATRCYETPRGVEELDEAAAFDLYRAIAELTTGVAVDVSTGARTVVGLRGAYPGTFSWNGNAPNRFNDTLVLLWQEGDVKHVRELPVNTDTGAVWFGADSSSSLRPNRRYAYAQTWHNSYNALHIDESGYYVRDDGNGNGHWDSDRNGWLPGFPSIDDRDRVGSGHNIHTCPVDAPLGTANVANCSAGCQVIPGIANWTEFIQTAWTDLYDPASYFLVDVRDIDPRVWSPCVPDGTHGCPLVIAGFPFSASGDTRTASARDFAVYNCSAADESGAEVVYLFTIDETATLTATLDDVDGDGFDVDVHLLDADDANACVARGNLSLTATVRPGRYFIVVDTWVDAGGAELPAAYTLTVNLS